MDEKLRKLEKEWSGKLIASYYEVVSILGQGAYGSVVRVQNTTNPTEQYAVKIIKREKLGKPGSKQFKLYNRLMTEKKITGLINQENILSCKKFINEKSNPFVFMFLDICNNGELDQYIKNQYLKKKIQIREGEAIHLLGSISNGFKLLNWYNIMHRDVKPANILVKDGVIKIADFGGMRFGSKQTGTVFGTRKYLAPEILQIYVSTLKNNHHEIKGNTHFYDSRVDVFSQGCMYYEILFSSPLLFIQDQTRKGMWYEQLPGLYKTKLGKNLSIIERDPPISNNSLLLLQKMTEHSADDRFAWDEFFKSPLMKNYFPYVEFTQSLNRKSQFSAIKGYQFDPNHKFAKKVFSSGQNFPLNYPGECHWHVKGESKFKSHFVNLSDQVYDEISESLSDTADKNYIPMDDINDTFTLFRNIKIFEGGSAPLAVVIRRDNKYIQIEFENQSARKQMYFWVNSYKWRVFVKILDHGERVLCSSTPNQTWEIFEFTEKNSKLIETNLGDFGKQTLECPESQLEPDHTKEICVPVYSYTTPFCLSPQSKDNFVKLVTYQDTETTQAKSHISHVGGKENDEFRTDVIKFNTVGVDGVSAEGGIKFPWHLLETPAANKKPEPTQRILIGAELNHELGKLNWILQAHLAIANDLKLANQSPQKNEPIDPKILTALSDSLLILAMGKNIQAHLVNLAQNASTKTDSPYNQDYHKVALNIKNYHSEKLNLLKKDQTSTCQRREAVGIISGFGGSDKRQDLTEKPEKIILLETKYKLDIGLGYNNKAIHSIDFCRLAKDFSLNAYVYKNFKGDIEVFTNAYRVADSKVYMFLGESFSKNYHLIKNFVQKHLEIGDSGSAVGGSEEGPLDRQDRVDNFIDAYKNLEIFSCKVDGGVESPSFESTWAMFNEKVGALLTRSQETLLGVTNSLVADKKANSSLVGVLCIALVRTEMCLNIDRTFPYTPGWDWDYYNQIHFDFSFVKKRLISFNLGA